MKTYNILLLSVVLVVSLMSCDHDNFLSRDPQDVLLEDQLWSNPDLVRSNLASLYDSKPEYQNLENYWNFTDFDEAFPSRNGDYWRVRRQNYDYGEWAYWGYGYIHNINLFLARADNAEEMNPADKNQFIAEARFLRANAYFEMVKRMGGVPLLTDTLSYQIGEDPASLYTPRVAEAEVYDFILSEIDAIAPDLPSDPGIKSLATWGAAMAMKSRAALYAGSIARYGARTPSVSLPNGIVGIPQSRAEEYYQTALNAATELIQSGQYSLYMRNPNNLSNNFTELFRDKQDNPEVIWAKDYLLQSETHQFTVNSQPKSLTEEGAVAGFVNPSLNLVQSFELLDNTFAPLPNRDSSGDLIAYEDKNEIFANRDARLAGTVILPGSQFKGQDLDIWAGVMESDGTITTGDQFGQQKTLPGESDPEQVVGFDGPIDQLELGTQTGFYIRKYIDPAPAGGRIGTGSDIWWIHYRLGEIYLNAAEAAFELGNNALAAEYMNAVRRRAGFPDDLEPSEITFDRIVNERKVELAFEGHLLWDYRRWRIAHQVWNGAPININADIPGEATAPSTGPVGLWPYKIHNPGGANDDHWVFVERVPSVVTNAVTFRLGNYYSRIDPGVLSSNPELVQNPNQ